MSSYAHVAKQSIVSKVVSLASNKLEIQKLRKQYAANAYPKRFDWDWTKAGYNRIAAINHLVAQFPNCNYLEIGCAGNDLFDSVPVPRKTGVDPAQGGTHRLTSDDFFAQNKEKFDVIFIDGLHTYDQVHRDIQNSIDCLSEGGWVLLHDMLPRDWTEHHVPNLSSSSWTGDVWKTAFEMVATEGLDFKIIKMDYGVGAFQVTKKNPKLVDLSAELDDKQFAYFYENISKLPLVDWAEAYPWLQRKA